MRAGGAGKLRPVDPKYALLAEAIRRSPTNRIIVNVALYDQWLASGPAYEPRTKKVGGGAV